MPILRVARLFVVAFLAAAVLAACKGNGGAASTPSAQLRIVQGNPVLQSVDVQIDPNGPIIFGAQPGVVQGFVPVSGASHNVLFFEAGTAQTGKAVAVATCVTPTLAVGSHYTLVLVNVNSGGTSSTQCVLYTEPVVTPAPGQGVVVYHNIAGNPQVKDANGNPTVNLFPVFCQPAAKDAPPCLNPATQPGGPVVNGAAAGVTSPAAVQIPTSITTPLGVGFSVTNVSGGAPLCSGLPSDPTIYPVQLDPGDTSNFVPNNSSDQTIAIYVTDSGSANAGTNACPVFIAGSTAI
jgi:hypothetical protein